MTWATWTRCNRRGESQAHLVFDLESPKTVCGRLTPFYSGALRVAENTAAVCVKCSEENPLTPCHSQVTDTCFPTE